MEMYPSCPREMHNFPLHIHLHLVELDTVLNIKGCQNVDKLQVCQNTWNSTKLVYIKTWEIKLLDSHNAWLHMTLQDTMMSIHHPTNAKFVLSIWSTNHIGSNAMFCLFLNCHIICTCNDIGLVTVPPMEVFASRWQCKTGNLQNDLSQWHVLGWWMHIGIPVMSVWKTLVTSCQCYEPDTDNPYWAIDQVSPLLKCKRAHINKELLNDSVLMVKMVVSQKQKVPKLALKVSPFTGVNVANVASAQSSNTYTITMQSSAISQLTKQVMHIKLKNIQILDQFDQLAAQMEAFMSQSQSPSRCHIRGHFGESSKNMILMCSKRLGEALPPLHSALRQEPPQRDFLIPPLDGGHQARLAMTIGGIS